MRHDDFARLMPALVEALRSASSSGQDGAGDDADDAPPPGDFLPARLLREVGLPSWLDALAAMHAGLGAPVEPATRRAARRRLVFNETLLMATMMANHRRRVQTADADGTAWPEPVVCTGEARFNSVRSLPSVPARDQRPASALEPSPSPAPSPQQASPR